MHQRTKGSTGRSRPRWWACCAVSAVVAACGGGDGGGDDPSDATAGTSDTLVDTAIAPNGDPCGDVPPGGRCVMGDVELCATPTGNATPIPIRMPCHSDESCEETPAGARCVLDSDCYSGMTECRGGRLAECQGGAWTERDCAEGCVASSLGASCRPSTQAITYEGTLVYELRAPRDDLSDWSAEPVEVPAQGFLILSFADGVVVDATTTSAEPGHEGRFAIRAVPPAGVDGDDFLVAMAARPTAEQRLAYVVADPGFEPGRHDIMREPNAPAIWEWSWTTDAIQSPAHVRIPIEAGAGAAHVFNYLRFVYDFAEGFYGPRANAPLAVWLGFGSDWSCGACFGPWGIAPFQGAQFASQVWMPGGADEGYWGSAVIAHELGHYVMSTYGTSPGEGGPHFFGIPSHPGLAWSEGFATWFSLVARGSTIYFDKQDGGFFWMDIGERRYGHGVDWRRPTASDGLFQLIDENEISAMLLGLTDDASLGALLGAISAPRMTQPPFARGYTRRAWEELDDRGLPLPYANTNASAPFVADYFDTLVCAGFIAPQAVDAVTDPRDHFPYPSGAPLCQRGDVPLSLSCSGGAPNGSAVGSPLAPASSGGASATCELTWRLPLAAPLDVRISLPAGASLVEGVASTTIPAGTAPGSRALSWRIEGPSATLGEVTVRADTQGTTWGYRAEAGLTPPRPLTVARDGFDVRVGGRDFGRAVALEASDGPRRATPALPEWRGGLLDGVTGDDRR